MRCRVRDGDDPAVQPVSPEEGRLELRLIYGFGDGSYKFTDGMSGIEYDPTKMIDEDARSSAFARRWPSKSTDPSVRRLDLKVN